MSADIDLDIPPRPSERAREPLALRDNVIVLDRERNQRAAIIVGLSADTVDLLLPDSGGVHRGVPARAVRRAG